MCTIYISHFEQTANRKYRTEHSAGLRLLSAALDDCFGIYIPAENLPAAIRTGTYGKPELISHPDIHFNISHSEDIAACALSRQEIGVDIEKIQPFRESVIRKVLTDGEKDFLNRMGTDTVSRQEWFFRFWTLKESRIKHSGMGLSMPLDSFSFQYDLNSSPCRISSTEHDLYFHQQMLHREYILSVCTSVPNTEPVIIYV